MNWSTFVPDLVVAVSAAIITVVVALGTYLWQLRRKDRQLVHNLADVLSVRRAFEVIVPRESPVGAEAERCFASVQASQDAISRLRDEIAPNARLRAKLHEMVLSCVDYKERVEQEPTRWQFALMVLRADLLRDLRDVEKIVRLPPGRLPEPGDTRARRAS